MRDRRLNWEFSAIHPQRQERALGTHRTSGDADPPEDAHMFAMSIAVSGRDETIEQLAARAAGRAAEHALGGSVPDRDALVVVNRNDRIHSRVDDAGQLRLGLRARL